MPRTTRKSLKTLQHAASDSENLVGRPSKSLKHQLIQETNVDVEVKRKNISPKETNISSKETQVNIESKISVDDLTNPDGASEKYWQILAEKRQVALQESLDENEKLRSIIEELKQENAAYKQMLDEASSFIEVVKEELNNTSTNDTGIDVNDVSTTDENAEEDEISTKTEISKD